nr:hypothetical protein BaRGS_013692 [Batillaria attramentaria]
MVGSVEEFHIECLKIVASDPHVLNLAPQNNKISEIEYLTQLGEEVYLYLTGAMEDAPPWIKELAKKVVAKQRQKIQNKNRLRPSKDVTIEIDYAEECSDIDVEPPQEQFHTQQAGHLHQQQTQEQNPGWPYAIVKQEPPDDYSFALSGGVKEETPAPVPEDSSATETDWSGCPESADEYEEDCDQFEDDGEDVIEDEECIDGGGRH